MKVRSNRNTISMFLRKGVLKIYMKLTGEHPCRSVISILKPHFGMDVFL